MPEDTQVHPNEKALLDGCKEAKLSEKHTEIVRDLFGWKGRKALYRRYGAIYGNLAQTANSFMGSIEPIQDESVSEVKDLVLTLLDEELLASLRENPRKVVEETLYLLKLAATWIIVLLELKGHYSEEVKQMINDLCYYAPEKIATGVVQPVIQELIERARKLQPAQCP